MLVFFSTLVIPVGNAAAQMGFVSGIYGNGFFCTGMLLSGSFSTKLTSFFMPSKLYLQNFLLFWLPVFNLDVLFGMGEGVFVGFVWFVFLFLSYDFHNTLGNFPSFTLGGNK